MVRALRPYPYSLWPHLQQADLEGLRTLRKAWPILDVATAQSTARRLLGVQVDLHVGLADLSEGPLPPAMVLLLETSEPGPAAQLRLPRPLAHALADRLLGGDGDKPAPHRPLSAYGVGALAYAAGRILAALGGHVTLRDLYEETHAPAAGEFQRFVRLPLQLRLGESSTGLDLMWPFARLQGASSAPAVRRPVTAPQLPLTLSAHIGRGTLADEELARLAPDDVLIPEELSVEKGPEGQFDGHATLSLVGTRRACFRCAIRGHTLVIESSPEDEERTMTEGKRIAGDAEQALVGRNHDAPVELSLELARYTLPLSQVATLAPGDVLTTGQPIGSHVTLLAAGAAIAEGELVEIDGEVGLRILRVKTGRDPSASE